jgi:hypothetical protein
MDSRRPECCIPDCTSRRWVVGRCHAHTQELRRTEPDEFQRLKSLTRADQEIEFRRTAHPPAPSWTYEPTEAMVDELMHMHGGTTNV